MSNDQVNLMSMVNGSGLVVNGLVELWLSFFRAAQILDPKSFGMPTFWPTLFGHFFPPLVDLTETILCE